MDRCPLCNDALHNFETPYKKVQVQTRLLGCKQFYHAADEEKRDTFLKMKAKVKMLCKFCTSWLHDSSECTIKGTCKFCNLPHAKGACALQSLVSCASSGSGLTKLCVQDFTVISNPRCKRGVIIARILFDSGSQTTLVTNKFAEQAGWTYSKARYTLAGIGKKAKIVCGKL